MKDALSREHLAALAAMVELGQEDRNRYLAIYAAENEETPEEIAAQRREVTLATEALAILQGNTGTDAVTQATTVGIEADDH